MCNWRKIIIIAIFLLSITVGLYYFAYCKEHELNESNDFSLDSGDHSLDRKSVV